MASPVGNYLSSNFLYSKLLVLNKMVVHGKLRYVDRLTHF